MQEGQLWLCSFSSVDIGFRSITFADALMSLEVGRRIYHYKIPVKGEERLLGQAPCFFFFFFSFYILNGWRLNQATHLILRIQVLNM